MKKILFIFIIINLSIFAQNKIQDESFNPSELNEPVIPFFDGTSIYEVITDINQNKYKYITETDSFKVVERKGWKVQIFSSEDYFFSDSIHTQALTVFKDEDVVKIFNSPYYKIRIGNCVSREEAEKLLEKAQKKGYRDSWIISTRVKVMEKVFSY